MVIYSMGVSADGFIADREGSFDWSSPDDEQFAFHLAEVHSLGAYFCGRRLYETMAVWETDPSLRSDALREEFAEVWSALPKVVFSRTLQRVEGNARLAEGSVAEELVAAREGTDRAVSIGGADLAAQAFRLGLVDELHVFRYPVVVGGGTPFLPPVTEPVALDLVETRPFAGRVVFESYRRAGVTGDGGLESPTSSLSEASGCRPGFRMVPDVLVRRGLLGLNGTPWAGPSGPFPAHRLALATAVSRGRAARGRSRQAPHLVRPRRTRRAS